MLSVVTLAEGLVHGEHKASVRVVAAELDGKCWCSVRIYRLAESGTGEGGEQSINRIFG